MPDYRNATNISHDLGTAVNIQMVVFGNMGDESGTGVAFTRNPVNGDKELYGDYLINAQGEDVVAADSQHLLHQPAKSDMPEIYEEFIGICDKLEDHYREDDVEFTIERRKLWMLQGRAGTPVPRRTDRGAPCWRTKLPDRQGEEQRRRRAGAAPRGPAGLHEGRARRQQRYQAGLWKPSTPAPAQPSASPSSTRTPPRSGRTRANPSSWCGPKPSRTTCTA